jgi:hypothetical protein
MCAIISLQLLSETFLILGRIQRDVIINVYWSSSKVHVILVRSKVKLNFLDRFSKNTQIQNFMKVCSVGAEFYSDGQTDGHADMTKLIVVFGQFANAPKNNKK